MNDPINDLKETTQKKEINMPGAIVSGGADALNVARMKSKIRIAYFSIGPETDDSTALEELLSREDIYIIYRETNFFQSVYTCVLTYYIDGTDKKDDKDTKESTSKV